MATNDDNFKFSEYSTDAAYLAGDEYKAAGISASDSGVQIMWWRKAQCSFETVIAASSNPPLDEMIFVVTSLALSLSSLFGHSYPGNKNGHTPSLRCFIDTILPEMGFNIRNDSRAPLKTHARVGFW